MSSATYAVTYTSVYTDSEPGRAFWEPDDEEISEGGLVDPQTPPVPQDEDEREPIQEFQFEEQTFPPNDSPTASHPDMLLESRSRGGSRGGNEMTRRGWSRLTIHGRGDDGDDEEGDASKDDAMRKRNGKTRDFPNPSHQGRGDQTSGHDYIPSPSTTHITITTLCKDSALASGHSPTSHSSPTTCAITYTTSIWVVQPKSRTHQLRIHSTRLSLMPVTTALPSPYPLPPSTTISITYHPLYGGRESFPLLDLPRFEDRLWVCQHGRAEGEVKGINRDVWTCMLTKGSQDSSLVYHSELILTRRRVICLWDRMTLQETVWIMEEEAYASRDAWAHSI
ncbi:hypothetical protein Tco_1039611 [Tanacetum coccineum]